MAKVFFLTIAFLSIYTGSIFSNTIDSLKELSFLWDQADKNTLVVFDVDEVLLTTEDHFGHPYAKYTFYPLFISALWKAKTKEEKEAIEDIISLTYHLPKRVVIEEETPDLIRNLQSRGVTVVALTHFPTEKIGGMIDVPSWFVNRLKEFGFSFSDLGQSKIHLEMEPEKKHLPLLQSGVIFTSGNQKGEVLKALFKKCNFCPSKVIFIDDLSSNVESVQAAMESLAIECHAYQYKGANRFFRNEVDMDILNYQIKYLLKNKSWISDKEVEIKRLEDK